MVCINDEPGLTLTFLWQGQIWSQAVEWKVLSISDAFMLSNMELHIN